MKKLLLSLGAIASVATPVAAVVACGSTTPDATPVIPVNGDDVKDAFIGFLTYGELANRGDANQPTAFADLKTATAAAKSTIDSAGIGALLAAVNAFNNAPAAQRKLPTTMVGANDAETTLFTEYQGKEIKAVLFYQDSVDPADHAGSATLVTSNTDADWSSNHDDFVEMTTKNKGFDTVNAGHGTADDHFAIRFDIVE